MKFLVQQQHEMGQALAWFEDEEVSGFLLGYSKTRWLGQYKTIRRVLELENSLKMVAEVARDAEQQTLNLPEGVHTFLPTVTEWQKLNDLQLILTPFSESTVTMSGQSYVTLSLALPLLFNIKRTLNLMAVQTSDTKDVVVQTVAGKDMIKVIQKLLDERMLSNPSK